MKYLFDKFLLIFLFIIKLYILTKIMELFIINWFYNKIKNLEKTVPKHSIFKISSNETRVWPSEVRN